MLQMAKRPGRERRSELPRDGDGRISRSEYTRDDRRKGAAWNRMRDVAEEIGLDPRMATQLGRLFYNRQVSQPQFEAGTRWADWLDQYDWIKLGRRRTPPPPSMEARSPGEPSDVLTDKDVEFLERFEKARSALFNAGSEVERATNRLCRGEGVGMYFTSALRGLDILAEHWGLTASRKMRRRNAS